MRHKMPANADAMNPLGEVKFLPSGIFQREQNSERRDFYELLWHTGAAQSDGACLRAEDINWEERTICFTRKKLKSRGTNLKPTLFRRGLPAGGRHQLG